MQISRKLKMAIKGKVLLNFNQTRDNIVGKRTKIYLYCLLRNLFWKESLPIKWDRFESTVWLGLIHTTLLDGNRSILFLKITRHNFFKSCTQKTPLHSPSKQQILAPSNKNITSNTNTNTKTKFNFYFLSALERQINFHLKSQIKY